MSDPTRDKLLVVGGGQGIGEAIAKDLGDRAGYPAGRARDEQFGLSYLRLDRELQAGMVVTIEPGIYQVPPLLDTPQRVGLSAEHLNREQLARFADGIFGTALVASRSDGCGDGLRVERCAFRWHLWAGANTPA